MKNKASKLLALIMAIAIVFSLAGCGKDDDTETTTTVEATTLEGETTTMDETTTIEGETTAVGETTTVEGETTDTEETTEVSMPTTKAQILAAYTDVMNYAKTAKPAYTKKEFQALPASGQKMEGTIAKALLPIAERYMDKAEDPKVDVNDKDGSMKWFPLLKSDSGCLLTDVSAIEKATCDELSNGNYKITIELNDEMNPEPYKEGQTKATSNTGNMFSPLAKSEIDTEVEGIPGARNFKYALNYYDCEAVLVYNPLTKEIVTLDQYMSVFVDIQDGKLFILNLKGSAILENTMKCSEFEY